MSSCHYLMIRVFQCEDSLTGILTGVYDGWASRLGHSHVRLAIPDQGNMELFCEYEEVMADTDKAGKVLRTIRERMGEDAAVMIARAAACPDKDKADLIYRMIVLGLHLKDGHRITGMLGDPVMQRMFELGRKAGNIAMRYIEIIRFQELDSGALLAVIDPEADVLALIAPHFSNRLPLENWMIYDRRRQKAVIHPAGKGWFLVEEVDERSVLEAEMSHEEARYGELWKCFFKTLTIEARVNQKLQTSLIPLKYRDFMKEFQNESLREDCEKCQNKETKQEYEKQISQE